METYTLQYASDIHLETAFVHFNTIIEPIATDLALCGDIGDPFSNVYFDFLKWASQRWTRVFLLAGNHEYYTENPEIVMSDVEVQIRKVCSAVGKNVIFLQKDSFIIHSHKIIVVGATLWTNPDLRCWGLLNDGFIGDPGYRGDYNAIYFKDEYTGKGRPAHPSDIGRLCGNHSAFLERTLNPTWGSIPEGWRVVVLTHHLPTFLLNDVKFKDNAFKSCYAISLDKLIKEPVVAWLCGHSHKASHIRLDSGTFVGLNPLGYLSERNNSGFSRKASISIYRENIAIPRKE